jgi:hypothetical protein
LRNPFSLAVQPGTGRLFANDVGQGAWEEVDDITAGGNYGWPITEGSSTDTRFKNPLYAYAHPATDPRSSAITGGTFYNPSNPNFPAQYYGKYFIVDGGQQVFRVVDPDARTATVFGNIPLENNQPTALPMYLTVGINGEIHYVARNEASVRTIKYVGGAVPIIGTSPSSITVPNTSNATFTVSAFGSSLAFQWQMKAPDDIAFKNIPGANSSTYTLIGASIAYNYAQFRCVVSNGAGSATSDPAILTVSGNHPPTPFIVNPPVGTVYRAGDLINFDGYATDAEDGLLAASQMSWRIEFQHLEHTHPFIPETAGITNGTFSPAQDGETSDIVWYRIYLTVTDSGGMWNIAYRDILPVKPEVRSRALILWGARPRFSDHAASDGQSVQWGNQLRRRGFQPIQRRIHQRFVFAQATPCCRKFDHHLAARRPQHRAA